jgi:two-component system, chemotaxis family, sensor kinase CheA
MTDQYRQAYQEEAREVLVELESALLELNERPGDTELIGRTFRALHTIKGSGAMFGFDDISAFTHHVENAFDRVRNGTLAASPDLIALALGAGDQIKAMLDEARGEGRADPSVSAQILAKLNTLTGTQEAPEKKVESASASPSSPPPSAPPTPSGTAPRDWRIHFAPRSDLIRNGTNPLLLLRELRQMGSLTVTAQTNAIPPLAELDPQRCYISWDLVLNTSAPVEAIRDVFLFVEDCCELKIEAVEPAAGPANAPNQNAATATWPAVERRSGRDRRASEKDHSVPSIRVSTVKLDQLVDLVGQLVTVQARLGELSTRSEDRDMQSAVEEVDTLTSELREISMSMRTLPMRATFERMKRLVYDLGRSLHKNVELTFEGGDTELDKTVIDQLNDPLMHLIRNCMDHGIEAPEIRSAAGKPAAANVHLSARHVGAQVLIAVSDDGKGIDREAVRAKAIEKGLIGADARLSETEVYGLILAPGFSTAKQITDVSGRGVGMDVVKRNVEALRGTVEIGSQPGQGSTVTLRLPLTLAIIDGLLVRVGEARYVMPLANTTECVELTQKDIEAANGKHLANIRGEIVPYIRLSEYLQMRAERPEREQVMIAETEHGRYGFVVDQVLGDHQTVIKSLGRLYRSVQIISGATILGDGSVALILDLHRLTQEAIKTMAVVAKGGLPRALSSAATAVV